MLKQFKKHQILILLILGLSLNNSVLGQACTGGTPTFTVDLTASASMSWTSTSVIRNGSCCGDNKCIEFILTLHPDTERIRFNIASGAVPGGALFWQLGCAGSNSVGQPICISGPGPHRITFCKPGNNQNTYTITAIAKPTISPPTYVSEGCTGSLAVQGYDLNTIRWNSIFPGVKGAYNHYLSCSANCSTTVVTAQPGYPPYIDYEVEGVPTGGCSGATVKTTVRVTFVTTKAVSILPANPTICFGGTATTITANPTGGLPPYTYLWNTGATTQSIPVGVGTYSVIVGDQTTCPVISASVTVTANPSPITANAGPDITSCANNSSAVLSGSVIQATGGTWTGGAGTYAPSNSNLTPTYTPTASEISNGSVRHILTTTGNGSCPPVKDTMFLTILPAPIVVSGGPQTVCGNNASTTLTGASVTNATGGIWSGGTGTFFPNASTLNAIYTPSATEITAGTVTLTLTSTGNGTCTPVSANKTITISTAPTVNANVDQTKCANNAVVTLAGSRTIATASVWSTSGTGTFANATNLNTTYTPSAADITNGSVTLTLTTTAQGTCNPVSDFMVVTFTPAPTVNAGIDRTVCGNNSSVVLNGAITVATAANWTSNGTGTFTPNATTLNATYIPSTADTATGSVTLTLTTTAQGTCNSVNDQMVITYTDAPRAFAKNDQTVCGNNPNVTLNGSLFVATTGAWTTSGSGTFSPNATTLNATYVPSSADTTAGTVTLTLTTTNNATCNPASDQMVVTITDAPIVNANVNQTVCANNAVVILSGSRTVATSSVWTTSGTGSFANSTNLNTTYTPSAADIAATTVTLTLATTAQGTCSPVSDQMVITITPSPIVNAGANQTVCKNNPSVTLNGSVTVATGGNWTTSGSGTFSPNSTTLNAIYNPSAGDILLGSATLTLTSTGNGSCIPATDQMIITLTNAPTVNAGVDRTVCGNNASVTLNGTTTVATGGIWTSSGTGIFSPNSSTLNATYTPSAAEITLGSTTLTLTTTGNGNCIAVADQMTITIGAAPTANANVDRTVCGNNATLTLNGAVTNATGFSWSNPGGGTFNPNTTTLNPTYTPSAAEIAAGTVTLTLTATRATCNPVSDPMTITITPAPTVNAGVDRTVCANNRNVTLAGAVTVATGGIWTTSGTGTFSSATDLNAVYTPSATDVTNGSVTLTLTTTGNNLCNAVNDQMVIFITPAPTVTTINDITVCGNNPSAVLGGTITVATGGTWTSTGTGTFSPNANTVSATYTPSAAEILAGIASLTLTTTGNGTCNAVSDPLTITITTSPTVNANIDRTVCANNPNVTLAGMISIATGGTWTTSGSGSFSPNANTLNAVYIPSPADIILGTATLTITTTGNGLCNAVADQMVISITPAPTANAGLDQIVCANNANVTLNGSVTIATGGTWTSSGSGTFTPNATTLNAVYTPSPADKTLGSITLTLTTTGNGTCTAVSDQMSITITAAPTVNAGVDRTVCANNATLTLAGSVTIATGGTWSGGGGTFNPNANTLNAIYTPNASEISAGIAALVLTTTGNGSCLAVTDTIKIAIASAPSANANADQNICLNNPVTSLNGSVSNASGFSWATSGTGTFTPDNTTLNATYTPSANDLSGGSTTLTLSATRAPSCNAVTDQMVITYTPSPTVNAGPDHTVCANNRAVTLSGVVNIATGGIWTTSGTGTFTPNATTLNAVYTPSAADVLSGSITLRLTTTGNGNCTAVFDQMTITITPAPTVNAGVDQSVCGNNSTATLNGSRTVASGGTWTSSGSGTFLPNATTLNATYSPSAAEISGGTTTLTLTTTGNGNCLAVSDQMIISITPAPTVNAGPDQSICSNNAIAALNGAVTVATGGTWVNGNGILSPNNSTLNASYTPTPTEITNGTVTLTLVSTGNGNCNTVTDDVIITITPAPTVNAGPDQTACASTASIPLNGNVTISSGGIWTTSGTGTFSPNASTLNASYVASATDKTNGSVTLTLTSTGNGNCSPVNDNLIVTFTAAPTVNAGPDQTVCTNDLPIQLGGSGSPSTWVGGTGTFTPNRSALNATYTPSAIETTNGSVVLTLTTNPSGACTPISDNVIITIPQGPIVNAGLDRTVCGDVAGIVLAGTVTNAGGGIWTTSGTGTFSPNTTTLNATYVPSAIERLGSVVTLTLTSTGNGACSPESNDMVITITTGPTANAGLDQTVCSNNANVNLSGVVTIASGGSWTTSGTGTFSPNNTTLNATYLPSLADTTAHSVILTLTTTGNGTCNATSDAMVVNFSPAPLVNAGADQTICADAVSTVLNGSIFIASGGVWSSTGTGAFSPNASTLNASYFPSAADTTAGSVTFTLTSTGNANCNAVTDQMVLTITPAPVVNAGADKIVCADANGVILNGAGITVATGATWSTSGTGTFAPNANTVNPTYTISAADRTSGTVTLTMLSTGNGTCNAKSDNMIITITPAPVVTAGPDQIVCSDITSVGLNGAVTVASGGTWTTSGTGIFTPDANTLNASYIPSAADKTLGNVTLTLSSTGNGTCNPVLDQMIITITPAPTANANIDQTVCADVAGVSLNGVVTIATGGTWTSNGTGSFSPNATALNASYIPSSADKTTGSVRLILTTTGNGTCNSVRDTMLITITPAPVINAGPDRTVCGNNPDVVLSGSVTIATGGVWSGGAGTFTPDANTLNATYTPTAGEIATGSLILTLTSTGNGTCNAVTDQMLISTTTSPTVSAGLDRSVCANNPTLTLNGTVAIATGADWSGGTGIFNPNVNTLNPTYTPSAAEIALGTVTLTLTSTGNGLCNPVTDEVTIAITPAPIVEAGPNQTVCGNNATITLAGTVSAQATGGIWSNGSGTFSPNSSALGGTYTPSAAEIAAGTVTLILTSTGNGTCSPVSDNFTVTITPAPTVNAGIDRTVCGNNPAVALSGSVTVATGGIWTSNGTGTFTPDATTLNATYTPSAADISLGNVTLTLTTTGIGTCTPVTDHMVIFITPAPTVNAGSDRTVCTNNSSLVLAGSVTVASGGTWSLGTGTFSPDVNTLNATYTPSAAEILAGTVTLTLTTTGNGLCNAVSDNITITITPSPTADANIDQTICADATGVTMNGSVTVGTGGLWSSSGTGSFSPNATTLNSTYVPSPGDKTAGTVTLTLTTTGNGTCNAVSNSMIVTITPAPTVDAGIDRTICADLAALVLNGAHTVSTGASWTTNGTGTFTPDNNTLNASYSPSAADTAARTITFTLTTTGNGTCNAVSDIMILNITPKPLVNAGFDQAICADVNFVNLNGSVVNAGGGSWSTSGTGTFSSSTTLNSTYNLSAADKTAGVVTLTLMSTGNGTCNVVTDQMVINIAPAPIVNAGSDKTVCADNNSVALTGASITNAFGGVWTSTGTGTFAPNATTLGAAYIPSALDKTIGTITLTLTSSGNGTCNAVADQLTLTITPAPTVNAGPDQTICADAGTTNLSGAVTVATGAVWSTASGTGTFSPDNTTLNATFTPSASQITAGLATLTLTTTGNGLCNVVTDQMRIIITPVPTVDAGPNKTVCADLASVPLTGIVTIATGGTWSTSGTGTFSPNANTLNANYIPSAADRVAGLITLTLRTTGNGTCNQVTDFMILRITPAPTVDAGPASLCANSTISLSGSVTIASGVTWTTSGNGVFAPSANILNPSYTPSNDDRTAGTVTLTITSTGNGTCNAVTDNIILNIVPPPFANAGADEVACANLPGVVLNGSVIGPVGVGGLWTSSGGGTFSPSNTDLNATYTPSALDINNANVTLTLTTTGIGTCNPSSDTKVITITPGPTISAGLDQTVCADTAGVPLNGSVTISTGAVWTSPTGGTFSPDANTLNATYIPSAADLTAGNVTLTLTSTGNGQCLPVADQVLITITPAPIVDAGSDQTLCGDVAGVGLAGSVSVASGGVWSASGAGSFAPSSNALNSIYYFTPADITGGTVTMVLTSTGNGMCKTARDTSIVTITPAPTVTASAASSCSDQPNIQLNGAITVATGAIWTTSGTGTFTPDNTTLNASYIPSAADIAAHFVNLTLTTTGSGSCLEVSTTFLLNIIPAPSASAGVDRTVCADIAGVALNGIINNATGGIWSTNGTGTFSPNATTLNATYIPSAADTATGAVTLVLTSTGNGICNTARDTMNITITPAPTVDAGPQIICSQNPVVNLNGIITVATGGTWTTSGTGTFDPDNTTLNATYNLSASDLTTGTITLTLTTTGNGTCNAVSDAITLNVANSPTPDAGVDQVVCANNAVVTLSGTIANAGNGDWTTLGSGTFSAIDDIAPMVGATYTPSNADTATGFVRIVLTTRNNGVCSAVTDTLLITITDAPLVFPGPATVCSNNPPIALNGTVYVATDGTWSTSGTGTFGNALNLSTNYTPSATDNANGSVILTLTSRNMGTCAPVSGNITLNITPPPIANAGLDRVVCADTAGITLNGSVTGTLTGTWTSAGTGTFTPNADALNATYIPSIADTTAGSVILTLATTNNGACNPTTDQMLITFTPAPTVNAGVDRTVCADIMPGVALNGTMTVSTTGIWTSTGTGTFTPNNTTLNAIYLPTTPQKTIPSVTLTLRTTNNGDCHAVSDQMQITITPAPTVDAGPPVICTDAAGVAVSGTRTVATGSVWSTSGTGTYAPNTTSLNATYVVSAADRALGFVYLILTTTGNGLCNTYNDTIRLNIIPPPSANAGADQTICAAAGSINLSGIVNTASGAIWSTVGTGTFTPDNISLNTVYNLTPADTAARQIKFALTTTGNQGCTPAVDSVTVIMTPAPVSIVNAGSDQTICADITTVPLNGVIANAAGGIWSTDGNGFFSPSINTLNADYLPDAVDVANGTIILVLTSTGNGICNPIRDTMTLTITPIPTINAGIDQTVCADVAGVNLNGIVTTATGGTWSTTGSGNFIPDANTLTAVYDPSDADTTDGIIILTLESTGNGTCAPVTDNMTITITPAPVVNAGPDQIVCADNGSVQLNGQITVATTATWTSSGTGTFNPNANTLNATYTPSLADLGAGSIILTLTTPISGDNCTPKSDNMELIITTAPTANAGNDQIICADSAFVTLNGSVTVANGGIWTSSGSGTFSPNNVSLNGNYTPSAADRANGSVRLYLTSTGNGNCNTVIDSTDITITPAPTVNAGLDQIVCADITGVTLNGNVTVATGAEWSTTGTGTFNPGITTLNASYVPSAADIANGNATLTLTTTGNGTCKTKKDNLFITITPAPTVDAGPAQSVCANNANVSLGASITVATGATWINGTGTFTPDRNSLNAIYTPSAAEILAGTVTLTINTTGNGTCNPATDNVIITITPAPVVNAGSDQTVCADIPSINLNGNVTVASGGLWSTLGTGDFAPNGTFFNASYGLSTGDTTDHQVTLVLTSTGNGGCLPVTDTMEVFITPIPIVNAGPDQIVCGNNSSVVLNGAIFNATVGTWSGGAGTFTPDANTLNATYTPSATDIANGNVTLTLTTTNGIGTCNLVADQMLITITTSPTANAGPDQSVCANNAVLTLNGAVTVGTGGTWTSSGAGTFAPNNNTLTTTYTLSPAEILAGTVTLTLSSTGNGSCIAATDNMVVTVTPGPTVNANVDQTVCGNNANVTLAGSVTVASGGVWSGGSGTFSPGASTLNATYSPSAAERVGGTIKLALTTTGNGSCLPVADTMVINITPAPTINAGPDQVVCANNSNVTLSGSVTQASGIIWSSTGGGTFNLGNTAPNAVYTPSVNERNAGVANLTITTTGFGNCIPISDQMKITITPSPIVNAGPDQTVCANNRVVSLNGSVTVATGATWTSNGTGTFTPNATTLNATYTPSAADVTLGTITLSLTSTGNGSCIPVVDQTTITITPAPTVTVFFATPICADVNSLSLNGNITNATGGVWSTSGTGTFTPNANTINASYNPSAADKAAGTVGLVLTTTGFGNCIAVSASRTLRITPAPTVNAGLDRTICADANTVSLSGTKTVATGSTWTTSGTGSFYPTDLTLNTTYIPSASDKTSGTVTLTLTTTGNGTCQAVTDNLILRITPAPTVNAGPDQGICADGATANVNGVITIATGGTWSTLGTGNFLPDNNSLGTTYVPSTADTAAHSVRLVLTTTGNGLCNAVSDTMVIAIRPTPIVRASSGSICADMNGATLNGRVFNANGGHWTTSGSGSFTPNAFTLNAHYSPSASDMTNGSVILTLSSTGHGTCNPVSDNMMLIITPLPVANAGTDQIICRNSSTLLLAQTFPNISYEWSTVTGTNIGNSALISVVATKDTSFVLTVTDSKGCSVNDTVTVLVTDPPIFNLASQHCLNGTGSPIVINSNPSHIPPLGTFQWFRNDTLLLGQNTTIHNSIRPGIHIIQYNAGSCSAYDTTSVKPAPTLEAPDQLFCVGVPNIVRATIIPKATYQWYEFDGVTAIGTNKDTLHTTITADKSFIVTVVDSNSCSNNDTILVRATPVPTLSLEDMPACIGDVVTLVGDPVVIVGNDHSYSWSKNGVLLPADTSSTLSVTTPGKYTLVYTTGQCVGYDTSNVVFNPLPVTNATDTVKFCKYINGTAIINAGDGTSYQWIESGNTGREETVDAAGKYYVRIFNQFGCSNIDSVSVKDVCPPEFNVPTAFLPGNPNFPGDNFLQIFGIYFVKFQMTIFNRWGEVIFYTEDRNHMWDGTYRGEEMPPGVYPYIITFEGEFEEFKGPYRREGTITLIR